MYIYFLQFDILRHNHVGSMKKDDLSYTHKTELKIELNKATKKYLQGYFIYWVCNGVPLCYGPVLVVNDL